MRKLHSILLAGSSLLLATSVITYAAVNKNNANEDATVDNGSNNKIGAVPEGTCYVEINCDDGCTVKESHESTSKKNYRQYVKSNTDLAFTFSLTSEGYDFPSLAFNIDNTPGKTIEYTYNEETGALSFTADAENAQYISIDAYAVTPSVDITLDDSAINKDFTFSYTGSINAADFGGGNVVKRSSITSRTVSSTIKGNHVKVYGNCTSFVLNGDTTARSEVGDKIKEIRFNHSVTTIDFLLFFQAKYIEKIYVGPDVSKFNYSLNLSDLQMYLESQDIAMFELEEVNVSEDNPYFDSRDNCKCLIDSKTNELLVGGGKGFVPEGVETIKIGAFASNRKVTYLRLPSSVRVLDQQCLTHSSISFLELSANLEQIVTGAFDQCNELTSVDFSNLEHCPQGLVTSNFETCRGMLELYYYTRDTYRIYAPFIHKNPNVMETISTEAHDLDRNWSYYGGFFATDITHSPSAVIISELDTENDTHLTTSMQFESPRWSYLYVPAYDILDPSLNDPNQVENAWYNLTPINHTTYSSKIAEKEGYKETDRLSSYCTYFYCIGETYSPYNMYFSSISGKEHIPFYDNAKTISFVKCFGCLGGEDIEGGDYSTILPYTFYGLEALKEITFAGGSYYEEQYGGALEIVGEHAFEKTGLKSIELPLSTHDIQPYAFYQTPLESISIPIDKCSVGPFSFAECPRLSKIDYVTEGEQYQNTFNLCSLAFAGDTALKEVNLPVYTRIGPSLDNNMMNPFSGCTSLAKITLAEGARDCEIDANGILTFKDSAVCAPNNVTLYQSGYKPEQTVPGCFTTSNAQAIGPFNVNNPCDYMFAYSQVKKIKISNLAALSNYMFANCPNLEVVDLTEAKQYDIRVTGDYDDLTLFDNSYEEYKILVKDRKVYDALCDQYMKNISEHIEYVGSE